MESECHARLLLPDSGSRDSVNKSRRKSKLRVHRQSSHSPGPRNFLLISLAISGCCSAASKTGAVASPCLINGTGDSLSGTPSLNAWPHRDNYQHVRTKPLFFFFYIKRKELSRRAACWTPAYISLREASFTAVAITILPWRGFNPQFARGA